MSLYLLIYRQPLRSVHCRAATAIRMWTVGSPPGELAVGGILAVHRPPSSPLPAGSSKLVWRGGGARGDRANRGRTRFRKKGEAGGGPRAGSLRLASS
ncbi:hypothetical protein NL676_024490 [Syzygium grande]|nr:hypothetical protein NL676_024490 [Syzygium grande]